MTVLSPPLPKIFFGMLFEKYLHFRTYCDYQLENQAVSIFSVIFLEKLWKSWNFVRNLGLWNLKKKYHGSVNFCSIFEKMVLMCSKNEEDYIYVPQIFIHHQLKVGGASLWCFIKKNPPKKRKKRDFSNFLTVLPPPKIIFGMLFRK